MRIDDGGVRLPALDGVRGLAILLVLLFHFVALTVPGPTLVDEAFWKLTGVGWAGVDLFFVLSGFLITGILYDSKATATRYFRTFYARRTLRIFPVYYLFLFLLIVLLPIVQPTARSATDAVVGNLVWYSTYLTNIRLGGEPLSRPDFLFTSHLWSLAVEEQFYLVWPAIVLVFSRRKLMTVCGILVGCALGLRLGLDLSGVEHYVAHEITPARMDTLAVGAFIALAAREPREFRALTRWTLPVGAASGCVVLGLFAARRSLSPYDVWVQTVGFTAVAFLFGALLVSALTVRPATQMHRIFTGRSLRWLGKYSYALYLFHWPAAALLAQRSDIPGAIPTVLGSALPGQLAFVAAAGLLSMGSAWLSWHLWESQFLKLRKLFPYARSAADQGPPSRVSLSARDAGVILKSQ